MESTGEPGRVHISNATYAFLKDDYYVEQAEEFKGRPCGVRDQIRSMNK